MDKNKGFTLIELLIVIAIIGILAAVALPFYEGHRIIAQLSEVENAMATVASGVTGYYESRNTWPDCPSKPAVADSLGVGLGNVTRIQDMSISGADGSINATVTGISPMVNNKMLILTPTTDNDGSLTWEWGCSSDFPQQFRPKSGRH